MQLHRGRHDKLIIPRIPVIALIDVMMVLLLYFIMAGSMASDEAAIASSLKTQKGTVQAGTLQSQIITVEPDGPIGVSYRLGQQRLTTRNELVSLLKQLPKETGVVVKVSGRVPVSVAAGALQACRDAGFQKVSYVPAY